MRLIYRPCALLVLTILILMNPNSPEAQERRPVLSKVLRGRAAISALGTHFPDLARINRISVSKLRRSLATDASLGVGPTLQLIVEEPASHMLGPVKASSAQLVADASVGTASETLYPLSDTFKLHSRPSAKRIIYLDFDGHYLSETVWNRNYTNGADIDAPPWDIDGNPASFSDRERAAIQEIWARVAEDFAPFDIDVTTELQDESRLTRTSQSDEYFGSRALISAINGIGSSSTVGIACVGSYTDSGDVCRTALIFPQRVSNRFNYIAEIVSHEIGHNLGLMHDGLTSGDSYYSGHGTGATSWTPIMGSATNRSLSQWSKGEYSGANNTEDDIAIIQRNGGGIRPDDHGNSMSNASELVARPAFSVIGIIESREDVDTFRFRSEGGSMWIDVRASRKTYNRLIECTNCSRNPAAGYNADFALRLLDGSGRVIATNNPIDDTVSGISIDLAAGDYYVVVEGVGKGDPATGYSDYGSIGGYRIIGAHNDSGQRLPPVAVPQWSGVSGDALRVMFTGIHSIDLDGAIRSFYWRFGDGSVSDAVNTTHTYRSPGVYSAELVVTDDQGFTDSVPFEVVVSGAAPDVTPTMTWTPIVTVTPTRTPTPRATPTPTRSATATGIPTVVSTSTPVRSPTFAPTGTPTVASTRTATPTLTKNPTPVATIAPTRTPWDAPTPFMQPTVPATATPAMTATPSSVLPPDAGFVVETKQLRRVGGSRVRATLWVVNSVGDPAQGVVVSIRWTGGASGRAVGITDADGRVRFTRRISKRRKIGLVVTDLRQGS